MYCSDAVRKQARTRNQTSGVIAQGKGSRSMFDVEREKGHRWIMVKYGLMESDVRRPPGPTVGALPTQILIGFGHVCN